MCIIVVKPAGKAVDKDTLQNCFEYNPDGAGFMFPHEGKVFIRKGYFTFRAFWDAWKDTRKTHGDAIPVVFHFRIATAGEVDKTNCHPHRIAPDLAFVHNGILSCVDVPKQSNVSDTIIYKKNYLQGIAGKAICNLSRLETIEKQIGQSNKFVFLNGRGEFVFANESAGIWDNGLWYSNCSYLPRTWENFTSSWDAFKDAEFNLYCEYCGKDLDTREEKREGLCWQCIADECYEYQLCGGCMTLLTSKAHKTAGWCEACGREIYGKEWPKVLRAALVDIGRGIESDY